MIEEIYKADSKRYESGMNYARSGRSGILMSRFTLGFWHNFGSISPYSRSKEIAHAAFDRGITCFDLANNYGPTYGTAETTFGRLMDESFRPYRDEMFITTKAGYDMWPGPYGNWGSRKYLLSSLDQSLKRMKVDYVDLFYSHRYDPETPLEETLQALVDAVRSGRALYAGISRWPKEAAEVAYRYLRERDVPCLCYQGKHNLLVKPDGAPGGIMDQAADAGAGYVAFSPLAQGLLTNKYLSGIPAGSRMDRREALTPDALTPETRAAIDRLKKVADARGENMATTAIRWILDDSRVTSILTGVSSVAQLDKNLAALHAPALTTEECALLEGK